MAIRGLVFDKDGTLFDFRESWALWCQRVLAQLAPGNDALQQHLGQLVGYDLRHNDFTAGSLIVNAEAGRTNRVWAAQLPDTSLDRIEQIGHDALVDMPLVPVTPLAPLLAQLRGNGLQLGVATNDFESGAREQLRQAGVYGHFDFVAGYDSGFGGKPGAGMIEAFCQRCKLKPAEVAMIGDSVHDLDAGANAAVGLKVAVLTGPAGRDDLVHSADVVLDSIAGLIDYFGYT